MDDLCANLAKLGLVLHGRSVGGGDVSLLGCELSRRRRETLMTRVRFWRIYLKLEWILSVDSISGWALEVVVGHFTFVGLLSREALCILHSVYAFTTRHYFERAPLWKTVREELRACQGIPDLLYASWDRQWNSWVVSTDASEGGWGVA